MNTLASDYADGVISTIRDNVDAGTPFGIDEDNGEELYAFDYLQDVLDILYVVTSDKTYRGAMIQIAWGGPGAWIDTMDNTLTVSWGSDKVVRYLPQEWTDLLDDTLAELFDTL